MTSFWLKIIALVTMIIDHTGHVFFPDNLWFRYIGRIAFPIYVFLVAEGCVHTKDIKKYLLRLGAFALISEIPFDLAFIGKINFISNTNVFYTFFLGVASVVIYEKYIKVKNSRFFDMMLAFGMGGIAMLLGTDYSFVGVAFMFIIYRAKNRKEKLMDLFLVVLVLYGIPAAVSAANALRGFDPSGLNYLWFFVFGCISVGIVCTYKGARGYNSKFMQWFFYAAYPLHILILALLKISGVNPILK